MSIRPTAIRQPASLHSARSNSIVHFAERPEELHSCEAVEKCPDARHPHPQGLRREKGTGLPTVHPDSKTVSIEERGDTGKPLFSPKERLVVFQTAASVSLLRNLFLKGSVF